MRPTEAGIGLIKIGNDQTERKGAQPIVGENSMACAWPAVHSMRQGDEPVQRSKVPDLIRVPDLIVTKDCAGNFSPKGTQIALPRWPIRSCSKGVLHG